MSLVISRQLLSDVSTQLTSMKDNVAKTVAHFTLDKVSIIALMQWKVTYISHVVLISIYQGVIASFLVEKSVQYGTSNYVMLQIIYRSKKWILAEFLK